MRAGRGCAVCMHLSLCACTLARAAGGEGDPALQAARAHGAPDGAESVQADRQLHRAQGYHDCALRLVGLHAGACARTQMCV